MKIQALLLADDPEFHAWLTASAPSAEITQVHASTIDELIEHIQLAGHVDAVFFEFNAVTAKERASLIEGLVDRVPGIAIAGLGREGDSSQMLAAMRAGARDFFVLNQDQTNLSALLARLLKRPSPGALGADKSYVFGVMSAVPYEGVAFLAEHLAIACKEQLGNEARALLVDVALPAGAANIFLNINQAYGVLDAINDGGRCDATLVDTAFAKHSSGIYVLSLPEDILGRPHIDGDELVTLLSVLRKLFACIVVSYDAHLSMDLQQGLIKLCNKTLLLTDQSILKSRHSKYLVRALRLENCPMDRVEVVVDNYRKRVGLEPDNLSELLELPVMTTLSTTADHRIQAMNQGEPMFTCAPKDAYCGGVRGIAGSLLGTSAKGVAAVSSGGFFGKLFSK